MPDRKGRFIVIEGVDEARCAGQMELLAAKLSSGGYGVSLLDFTKVGRPSGYFVGEYQQGIYGETGGVGPYTASLFYALDRYAAAPHIREALENGQIVLASRFTGANMAAEGAKFQNVEERRGFFIWLDNLEFQMLGIPRPDMSFIIQYKDGQDTRTAEVYGNLARLFPKDFTPVDCSDDNNPGAASEKLWHYITPLLPEPSPVVPAGINRLAVLAEKKKAPAGKAAPADSLQAQATSLRSVLSPAAAVLVHRIQRSGQEVQREIIARLGDRQPGHNGAEPVPKAGGHFGVREVTVQCSLLLSEHLLFPHGAGLRRLQAIPDEPTIYVPGNLDKAAKAHYRDVTSQIAVHYSALIRKFSEYWQAQPSPPLQGHSWALAAARPVLPVAVQTGCSLLASDTGFSALAKRVLASNLPESRACAKKVSPKAGYSAIAPMPNPQVNPDISLAIGTGLPLPVTADNSPQATLLSASPRNELSLAADILYPAASQPLAALRDAVGNRPYDQKLQLLESHASDPSTLAIARYDWEVISDYRTFLTFSRYLDPAATSRQPLAPHYGHDLPELVGKANAGEEFERCFDLSRELYRYLQEAGHPVEAQYATLLGNHLRWKATCSAAELANIATQPRQTAALKQLIKAMAGKVAEVHPALAPHLLPAKKAASPAAHQNA